MPAIQIDNRSDPLTDLAGQDSDLLLLDAARATYRTSVLAIARRAAAGSFTRDAALAEIRTLLPAGLHGGVTTSNLDHLLEALHHQHQVETGQILPSPGQDPRYLAGAAALSVQQSADAMIRLTREGR